MSKPATERLVMKAKKDFIDLIGWSLYSLNTKLCSLQYLNIYYNNLIYFIISVIVACLLQLFTGVSLLEIPNYILNNKKTRNN